jgi:hypothetical protein
MKPVIHDYGPRKTVLLFKKNRRFLSLVARTAVGLKRIEDS